ncbi:hypothetical protein AUR64_13150 [Haloprofundus marisrubri]|uniref:Uncharacterized protein n=1 Tax=Haloprofundus marisrubri TaxID=1514971 RepID=A0A0W1R6B8_9EURY|nr:DUF5807 family protein [Haloprofundus marisrubri]KTG08769.1 hypothetical protein AUR64_13150 [Haloprofundus marisrubri]
MSDREAFLAGERLDDVALFLTDDYLDEQGKIANYGETVDGGVILVEPGDKGRQLFAAGTGMKAMEFAQSAMGTEGDIADDLSGGACPAAENDEEEANTNDEEADESAHRVRFVFAFAEAQNEEVGGLYADGDVIHAYAQCECGQSYSDRWLVDA